jgi:hypothetical protein
MKFTNSLRTSMYATIVALLLTSSSFAQAPEKMSYQVVIRDANNALVTSQQIGMQITILQVNTAVYEEIHTPTSNTNGLVSLEIGTGTVISGSFTAIDWSIDTYFIKTETDPIGGTNYTITGTSQLLSVPYALYAETSNDTPAVALNTAKVSYTEAAVSANIAVSANTAKTVISSEQSDAIVANTAKIGYTQPTYFVNNFYEELGGYIIEVSASGKHGIVAARLDQGTSNWYNTINLLSNPDNHDAAGAEFKDWRMPSNRELNLMYGNKSEVGGLTDAYYWSSSEYDVNGAWLQDFSNGNQYNASKSGISSNVRAVRAF